MTSMQDIRHNSALCAYRLPMGAVCTGQKVTLRLQADPAQVEGVTVRIFINDQGQDHPMALDREGLWSYTFTAQAAPGVDWYYFIIHTIAGHTLYMGLPMGQTAGEGQLYDVPPCSFQLTVYKRGFTTPDWFKRSTMYQIFPDRYSCGDRAGAQKGLEYHRQMGRLVYPHQRWDELPLYEPLPGQPYYAPCDFFGGDLKGIEQHLDDLRDLGVTVLYLNPIVEAASNHRYDTADYKKVDPVLGSEQDFIHLCQKAATKGIRILLDGVYSHTGSDSVYFNKNENYPGPGAYQGKQSPYYKWYQFGADRDDYKSWWGFDTLPEVDEEAADWQQFVITGKDSVFNTWLARGAAGFRLDVADELPDDVIEKMRTALKRHSKDDVLLGEVWEDATIKESYGAKRTYALGQGLDSVMNYPLKEGLVRYLLGEQSAGALVDLLLMQRVNYPQHMYYCLMNLLSSHDIARIRTRLATGLTGQGMDRPSQVAATRAITPAQDQTAAARQKLAMAAIFSLPGVPCIYYGDEWGMHGLQDPLNRGPFMRRDRDMAAFTKRLSAVRAGSDALKTGHVGFVHYGDDLLGILRLCGREHDFFGAPAKNGVTLTLINRADAPCTQTIDLHAITSGLNAAGLHLLRRHSYALAVDLLSGHSVDVARSKFTATLPPLSAAIFQLKP
ncbi:Alpha-amylase/pullulanase [Anaerotruncus sp. 2789STDY5834896]|uniref:Alpha-amylase/pullulanase n=1 Tax=uncultured Anaerotruncus sp. TaxID=905011 RepID=A0A1C6J0N3_9FIRM|nr:Alpha-amylase/pullulanase [uncultured Anaerotruncus sp.]